MEDKLIRCSHIGVDCVENDPVDIRCGGPEYLGFDFYVKEDETENMKKFISVTLKNFEIPLQVIYVYGIKELNFEKVWTKEKIVKSIQENAEYLKSEASHNYSRRR